MEEYLPVAFLLTFDFEDPSVASDFDASVLHVSSNLTRFRGRDAIVEDLGLREGDRCYFAIFMKKSLGGRKRKSCKATSTRTRTKN